jgi:hypothetical protein
LGTLTLAVAETAMGKPLSNAWEGGDFDVLGEREEVTKSEVQHVSGKHVLIGIKVRPKPFRPVYPCSFSEFLCIMTLIQNSQ